MSDSVVCIPMRELPAPSAQSRALARDLGKLLDGRVSVASQDRLAYARDLWPKALIWAREGYTPRPPDVVAWPETTEQVAAVTRHAAALGVPLVPFGGGSGVCGAALPLHGGIVLDLKRMARILSVDADGLEADVEAGIIGEIFERRLNRLGLSTGHFPSSMYCSTVGGWIAARGAGQMSSRYGKIEDMLAALTVVDGRGEVIQTPRRPMPGWNLTRVFVGSEGALGTVCSARLHLVRVPEARVFQAFLFRSVREGVEAIRGIFRSGARPAVARLYDPLDTLLFGGGRSRPHRRRGPLRDRLDELLVRRIEQAATQTAVARPIGLNLATELLRSCLLILLFEGPPDLCEVEAEEASRVCLANDGEDQGPEPARAWLEKRYDVSYKQSRVFDIGGFVDTMEVAGTWDRVVEIYDRVRAAIAPLAFVMCHFSHAYLEGCCLYFTFAGAAATRELSVARYDEIWRRATAAATLAGATASHHHGVGIVKLNALKAELGDGLELVRALKATFDPKGILNPGKLGV
jgi:alkyldihydroxyacetonephosphate synthase